MHRDQIIRAWKDEAYRAGLSQIERAALPVNPAGLIELPDELMDEPRGLAEEGTFGPICKGISLVICDSWFPIGSFACCNALQ
jgi:mersacidin/lichenicidin family type 2 lantibiotic